MKAQNISRAYAKALYDLGKEKNIDVPKELTAINEVIASSSDLENLLFLEVFTPEEKILVINEVMNKMGTSSVVQHFMRFLIEENREGQIPLIFKDLIIIDDHERGFLRGVIEGNDLEVNESFKEKIMTYLKKRVNKELNLEYKQNENITAGYRVTVEDLQLDASLDNQLERLKQSVLNS